MSRLIILPSPLSSSSISLGQLRTDPFSVEATAFDPLLKPACQSTRQPSYQNAIVHDDHGRFITTASDRNHNALDNILVLQADESSHASLAQPRVAFNSLRRDAATQVFLRRTALQHQALYYVTGIQKLHNPSYRRAAVREDGIAEASGGEIRLPMHVRRVDSAANITSTKSMDQSADDSVFAVELLKVRCRVSAASTPHEIDDVDYEWTYHRLDDGDLQLEIGLGKSLEPSELRSLAGIADYEDFTEGSWDYRCEDDDGLGGF
jgi:hypothetical protein